MRLKTRLLSFGVMAAVSAALPGYALAQAPAEQVRTVVTLDIPAGPAAAGLNALATQADVQLFYPFSAVRGRSITAVKGEFTRDEAIHQMAQAAGLRIASDDGRTVTLEDPQGGSAAAGGAEVEALIVTAQKREEDIQDVPIAISAFTQEDLTRQQIAGGPDLITQVPNMTFTKTNFSSYSVQLRGIGTQAISATTDPAVAVAFNNTPFIRNRFFEQEFYDLQRVEVLRGPQGTLYGRNATAGVVNIISQKPKFSFEAKLSGDVSNYNSTRLEGMINIPLVEDKVALRLAGAWTKRDGYATNEIDGEQIDGRDLWSSRVSLRFSPNERLDANLIWEHFEENDDRLRSGKQLCKKHVVTQVGDTPVLDYYQGFPGAQDLLLGGVQGTLSQGCVRDSLYSPDSFQTPNGFSVPYYFPLSAIGLPGRDGFVGGPFDPYLSETQSHNLRVIESTLEPEYKAKADIVELQVSFDLTDTLTLASETAYGIDEVFSFQDFNRFNTAPGAFVVRDNFGNLTPLYDRGILDENGVFCDPQLGCTSRLVAADVSTARARQFSQEFRLSSDFEGAFNFSLGANYLRADSLDKYYVFINTLTLTAAVNGQPQWIPGVTDNASCLRHGLTPGDPSELYVVGRCTYIDPNPIPSLDDQGHNYFLSNNPYKLISYAVFGEAYYNVTDTLKVTAGLRWTVDKKEAPRQPTWLLVAHTYGYPVAEVIEQEWREPTGRLTVDWKPDLAFTDETLVYASYAHGYKAGGSNPPPLVQVVYAFVSEADRIAAAESATRPKTFDAEFVDAFELGSKNTLLDGALTLNLAAFYYDYKDYQISEIVDRSAFNRNFDAKVWGIELESDWRPLENLRLGLKIGYEEAEFADGERAIDLMDRTAGMPGWEVVKPFPTYASNCILPSHLWEMEGAEKFWGGVSGGNNGLYRVGNVTGGSAGGCELAYVFGLDPITSAPYVPNPIGSDPDGAGPLGPWGYSNGGAFAYYENYPGFNPLDPAINNGEGFLKDLGGNELPNAPNLTATITADYTIPLPSDWLVNLHTDLHWQAESDWRPFQDHEYSKLDEYFTMNLAAIFTNEELGWNVMAYIKNVTDETAITGAFLNSDDTGLTTNVFLTEPRLYGLRVTKVWNDSPWFVGFDARNAGPAIFTVELGGQVQQQDAPYSTLEAGFEDAFPASIDIFADAQNRDLDWGDGREVKLTWRPNAGPWTVSAGVRYGRTNNETTRLSTLEETESVCLIGEPFRGYFGGDICDPLHPYYDLIAGDGGKLNQSTTIWSAANGRDQERHQLIDFAVGRDFGIGGLSRSAVSAGLRHASFDSWTRAEMFGAPDRHILEGGLIPGPDRTPFHQYTGFVEAQRDFEGTGPTLSWEASLPLLGGDDTGHLELDWSVSGGMLFGKQ
ncbi:MAG TPA: TonB-dependent receptor, partial [Caulobacteraceae bacterium]|nr:TonB-dependent receptor [Caulobacteraceae bacterium]